MTMNSVAREINGLSVYKHIVSLKGVSLSLFLVLSFISDGEAFVVVQRPQQQRLYGTMENDEVSKEKKDNKAMQFLKDLGKVGGSANRDFRYAVGVDEGPSGKSAGGKKLTKVTESYDSCVSSGVIDDFTNVFPTTSSGTRWSGYTDQVMGGLSMANLSREVYYDRTANVLRGTVSMANNGGFIQMATNLAPNSDERLATATVDASSYSGIELDVRCYIPSNDDDAEVLREKEEFSVHIKTADCPVPYASYRTTFDVPVEAWTTVQLPFSQFVAKGPSITEIPFDLSSLTRLGIVAIGRPITVQLAISGIRLY